ncbi:MAG: phytoene/squalene synthase family protein [Betaproteobacteria bacterium]
MPPRSPDAALASAADRAACAALLRGGSRTFDLASRTLPRDVRDGAIALYAFCREADDAIDRGTDHRAALATLQTRLDAVYGTHRPASAVDRALADAVAFHQVPRVLLDALLEGFEWDAAGRNYETLDEVLDYAARVAGTVGAMMALVMGARSAPQLARACDLGVAMQLTNIARDVGEDARLGRLYLPRAWLREAGLDPDAWLAAPRFDARLGAVVERLLTVADDLYERACEGIDQLPASCRPAINAARLMYAEIGHEVRRRGLNSVAQRAVVPGWRKSWLLFRALLAALGGAGAAHTPALPATRFLVDAAATHAGAPGGIAAAWWRYDLRVATIVDILAGLERRDRAGPVSQTS